MTHKLIIYVNLKYLISTFESVTHFMLNLFKNEKKILYKRSTFYPVTKPMFAGTPTEIITSNFHQCLQTEFSTNSFFLIYSTERNGDAMV